MIDKAYPKSICIIPIVRYGVLWTNVNLIFNILFQMAEAYTQCIVRNVTLVLKRTQGWRCGLGDVHIETRCSSLTKIIINFGSYMSGSAREEMNSVNLIFRVLN